MSAPPATKPLKNSDIPCDTPIERLRAVMARLRDPEHGCPWDIEQTFESIIPHTIEEAYEVADAIERGDMEDFKDELGDLLMQVIFHARMAEEKHLFDFNDIVDNLVEKLIFRHPHVFGDQKAQNSAEVVDIWEAQKAKKRKDSSTLAGVTRGLPALLRAQKLQKKVAKQGFTWKTSCDAWTKVTEEYAEVQSAISEGNQEDIAEELGDLMFCLVNYARLEGLDAEEIMRQSNNKFINNYNAMESFLKVKNKKMKDCDLAEMLDAWKAAKQR